jgi:phage shock protein A
VSVVTITHCRENLQQQVSRVESLKSKLGLAENSAKSFETLAIERAHQITSLERECKVREDRLSTIEVVSNSKESKVRELETKMAASTEMLSALQIEKERLSQQVRIDAAQRRYGTRHTMLPSC